MTGGAGNRETMPARSMTLIGASLAAGQLGRFLQAEDVHRAGDEGDADVPAVRGEGAGVNLLVEAERLEDFPRLRLDQVDRGGRQAQVRLAVRGEDVGVSAAAHAQFLQL